jgi:hypothetical protein
MRTSMITRWSQPLRVDGGLAGVHVVDAHVDEHVVNVHVDDNEVVATGCSCNIAAENQEIPAEQQEIVATLVEIESLDVGDLAGRRSLVLVDVGRGGR